ncbi:MAG: FxsA family protein [Acidimicrobiia bacterium]
MAVLVALLIVVPIAELYTFVQVTHAIGFFPALLAVFALSFVGTWVVRLAGWSMFRRMRGTMRDGKAPTRELVDGFLILMSGALLLVPGFLTGALGLVLLVPPVRALVRTALIKRFRGNARVITATHRPDDRARRGATRNSDVIDTDVVDDAASRRRPPQELQP